MCNLSDYMRKMFSAIKKSYVPSIFNNKFIVPNVQSNLGLKLSKAIKNGISECQYDLQSKRNGKNKINYDQRAVVEKKGQWAIWKGKRSKKMGRRYFRRVLEMKGLLEQ